MTTAKTKWRETSLGGYHTPRKRRRDPSHPDKHKGHTRRPRALGIVLMLHAYSPTVSADWNHRMFLVISFPRMWKKRTRDWFEMNPVFVSTQDFFKQVFPVSSACTCKQSPRLNHYLFLSKCHTVSAVFFVLFASVHRCVFSGLTQLM